MATRAPRVTVDVKGDRDLRRALNRLGPRFKDGVARSVRKIAFDIEGSAKRGVAVAFGRLRAAIRVEFNRDQTQARVGVFEGTRVRGNQINYAPYVELGTQGKPRGFPPIRPIRLWSRRVLGDAGAAFSVALKVYEEGTDPQPFLEPAFEQHARRFEPTLRREVGRELRAVGGF